MTFQNRVTSKPGIIKLRDVDSGEVRTYEVMLADEPSQEGTPITAETLEKFKQEILTLVQEVGAQGPKGDKGDTGPYITAISITRNM